MTAVLIGIVVGIIVVFVGIVVVRRTPSSDDRVADFRRHLDALSPDARQQVIETVRNEESRDDGA